MRHLTQTEKEILTALVTVANKGGIPLTALLDLAGKASGYSQAEVENVYENFSFYFKERQFNVFGLLPSGEDFRRGVLRGEGLTETEKQGYFHLWYYDEGSDQHIVRLNLRHEELVRHYALPALRHKEIGPFNENNLIVQGKDVKHWDLLYSPSVLEKEAFHVWKSSKPWDNLWWELVNEGLDAVTFRFQEPLLRNTPELWMVSSKDQFKSSVNVSIILQIQHGWRVRKLTIEDWAQFEENIQQWEGIRRAVVYLPALKPNKNAPAYGTHPELLVAYGFLRGQKGMNVIALLEPGVEVPPLVKDYIRIDAEGNWQHALQNKLG